VIRLTRTRTKTAIPKEFRGAGRKASERALLVLRSTGLAPDASVWKKAKKQLKKESGGKCAYCEGKASHVAHGDVEHFRPKTVYWWLAYCYDNYTYACQICNQSFKGSNFPVGGPPMVAPQLAANPTTAQIAALAGKLGPDPLSAAGVTAFEQRLAAELPGLPDPYLMDPEPLFMWFADDVLGEVEIRARDAAPAAQKAMTAVDQFLGLNREELRKWRYKTYEVARAFVLILKILPPVNAQVRDIAEKQLKRMMAPTAEFAAMVRYLVRDVEGLAL